MSLTKVDIILPCYRPAVGWFERTRDNMARLNDHFAGRCQLVLHVVNDGSDESCFPEAEWNLLRGEMPDAEFHSYPDNHGKGYCLRYGVSLARNDLQVYTDCDFPFGWEGVAKVIEILLDGADVVMGQRGDDYVSALDFRRKAMSCVMRLMNRWLLGIPSHFSDTQAGIKGFNRVGREIFLSTKTNTFLFDAEFIAAACHAKPAVDIRAVPVTVRKGIHFSTMGKKVVLREFAQFLRVFRDNLLHLLA